MNPMALSCISRNILSSEINELQEGIRCISESLEGANRSNPVEATECRARAADAKEHFTCISSSMITIPQGYTPNPLLTCEAKEHGVRCQRQATVNHIVNATGWTSDLPESRYYPPEERHLCDEHFRRVMRLELFILGVERLQMEGDVA